MREIQTDLASHLKGQAMTMCHCWRLTPRSGQPMGFTDHDKAIMFDGIQFLPSTGMDASAAKSSIGLNADDTEVMGALSSEMISSHDIAARRYDGAKIEVFLVNWQSPAERILKHSYLVGEIVEKGDVFQAELRSPTCVLDQTQGLLFIPSCQATLGDARCKLDINAAQYRGLGTVTEVLEQTLIRVSGLENFADQWFDLGEVRWTSGKNSGARTQIVAHRQTAVSIELTLWVSPGYEISPGDKFDAIAGCSKDFKTCKSKFSNELNFVGFPHMPGEGFATSYAANSEKMDGGVIIP